MVTQVLKLKDCFSSFDLALAAVVSMYYPLEAIEWTENPHRAKFLFKRDNQLDQLISSYYRGELKINPQVYFNSLKSLKGRLFENR